MAFAVFQNCWYAVLEHTNKQPWLQMNLVSWLLLDPKGWSVLNVCVARCPLWCQLWESVTDLALSSSTESRDVAPFTSSF